MSHPREGRALPRPHTTDEDDYRRGVERAKRGGYLLGGEPAKLTEGFLAHLDEAQAKRGEYGLRLLTSGGILSLHGTL